ncbi:hypothetical protein MA5S0422_0058 [Mycobacteroides abscessus 5S-0422]|uniref:Uncharacterized protein n=1 Tax=Mycobacteroides abscessus subsp. bolletii 1513 TaxID=1299321 RepID=X8DJ44_9MYCO|nr:hypothetical protein [Mycobacteroides abscessus]EUA67490.1 hypothetical protein I540_5814 [Mycobacteroides abscessus subsp. bolletii 1513]EIU07583.1 hypothetical protein MA5S0421_4624 [Mycobacteroides abscessus 5S-0421]EIU10383.1 hypothetical protein MA5S0304_4389 [Mycobacteroides abscessus 5S-0304]EIU19648.1 hypothetical protein MA5S0422_0058 [Mycobacteroides abscessus 5S-0422]EIU22184.1 hypothetical protein MA5S0708_4316 [Mycobacteroides abscessus 5S-0708]
MDDVAVERHELVINSRDKQVGLRLPLAVDQRIDALMSRATEAGERTNRKELIAALLATADMTGEELGNLLRRYRRSKVAEVLLDLDSSADVIPLVAHKPGPRPVR